MAGALTPENTRHERIECKLQSEVYTARQLSATNDCGLDSAAYSQKYF